MPRVGQVLGLVGKNGIGKSTAMKILGGKLKPNLGKYADPPDWQDVLTHFRGSELQNYFTRVLEDKMKATIKPQYVDHIPRSVKGIVGEILKTRDERGILTTIIDDMDLGFVTERELEALSGGELQRFAIAVTIMSKSDCYMFDEPSSYLDVRQRVKAARTIRSLLEQAPDTYVVTIDHDLAVQDYLSDFVCVLYGTPGAYGVVTMPFAVRDGINVFLAGFIPTENLRFRDTALTFKVAQNLLNNRSSAGGLDDSNASSSSSAKKKAGEEEEEESGDADLSVDSIKEILEARKKGIHKYPLMRKSMEGPKKKKAFKLTVQAGEFRDAEIIIMLGENGTGKTTFIRMLAGLLEPDANEDGTPAATIPKLNVSYKPQKIAPKFEGTVSDLLLTKMRAALLHPQFKTDVLKPMLIEPLLDQQVQNLSGGELQRVALTLCLGTPADLYLIDEPSAYLDSEQRIATCKMIKRFILNAKKTAFIVEHDFIMATYLADRVIVYEGQPGVEAVANSPEDLLTGMNKFLKSLELTFRRDPTNYRPRINKPGSAKDTEQKKSGQFFFLDD